MLCAQELHKRTVLLTKKGSLWLYTSLMVPGDEPRLPSISFSCELSTTDCSSDTWLMAFTRSIYVCIYIQSAIIVGLKCVSNFNCS